MNKNDILYNSQKSWDNAFAPMWQSGGKKEKEINNENFTTVGREPENSGLL